MKRLKIFFFFQTTRSDTLSRKRKTIGKEENDFAGPSTEGDSGHEPVAVASPHETTTHSSTNFMEIREIQKSVGEVAKPDCEKCAESCKKIRYYQKDNSRLKIQIRDLKNHIMSLEVSIILFNYHIWNNYFGARKQFLEHTAC